MRPRQRGRATHVTRIRQNADLLQGLRLHQEGQRRQTAESTRGLIMSKQHGKYLIKFGDQVRSYHSADPACSSLKR